jgi:hypothetical protein
MLYTQTTRAEKQTEELHETLKKIKQQLRETRAESRGHSQSLNPRLKRTVDILLGGNHASVDEEAFASIGCTSHKQVFAGKVNVSHNRGATTA